MDLSSLACKLFHRISTFDLVKGGGGGGDVVFLQEQAEHYWDSRREYKGSGS